MGKKKVYVIRGGNKEGIYNDWSEALSAGFLKKQGYGNACKIEGDAEEVDTKADAFLQTPPNDERVAKARQYVDNLPYFIKLILFLILTLIGIVCFFYTLMYFGKYMGCEDSFTSRTAPVCVFVVEIQQTLVEHQSVLMKVFAAEIIALIVFISASITNVVKFNKD